MHLKTETSERKFSFRDVRLEEFRQARDVFYAEVVEGDFVGDLRLSIFGLMEDTKRALNAVTNSFAPDAEIQPDCARRLLTATLLSEIEGSVFIAASHLNRFGVGYPEPSKDLLIGDHKEVQERTVRTLELFSANFGSGVTINRFGPEWESFATVRNIRNRVTHPKRPADLLVSIEELEVLMTLSTWWHGESA